MPEKVSLPDWLRIAWCAGIVGFSIYVSCPGSWNHSLQAMLWCGGLVGWSWLYTN